MFLKFIIIGILNTGFYYILYSLLLYLFNNYILAIILANIVGILFSFKTFSKFVFSSKNNQLIWKFLVVYTWNIILNIVLVGIFSGFIENYYISGFFASGIVALNSYTLNKKIVFKDKK